MEEIRYFKVKSNADFACRIHVNYKVAQHDDKGNISYPAEFTEWKSHGYNDICKYGERTLDLKDTGLADGSIVQLKMDVVFGKDKTSDEQYIYNSASGKTATYIIKGQTLSSKLWLESCD